MKPVVVVTGAAGGIGSATCDLSRAADGTWLPLIGCLLTDLAL